MHFNFSHFEVWRLLVGGAYADLRINVTKTLIKGWRLLESRCLLEEIRYHFLNLFFGIY